MAFMGLNLKRFCKERMEINASRDDIFNAIFLPSVYILKARMQCLSCIHFYLTLLTSAHRFDFLQSYSNKIRPTDLECPLSQGSANLPSPPVSEAFKERLESLAVNTLVLHERKLRRSILSFWVAMVTSQKVSCLGNKQCKR